jgi:hypothetical protein
MRFTMEKMEIFFLLDGFPQIALVTLFFWFGT